IPLFLQVSAFGWLNSYKGLIVPTIYTTFGIFIMRQFIEGIPGELLEAARIDGASELWIYARIILPLSTSALAILGLLHFFAIWDSFLWPLSIISQPSLRTLPVAVAGLNSERGARYDLQLAASVLTNLPVLVIYFFAQRRLSRGIALTGSKM
ncbi:MAG: carbohydrate ABC transporter permease, partial [Acidobacteria bacterium]|nr:carbohydrate ABC transporter permease [Acidobacteriota bacterium]